MPTLDEYIAEEQKSSLDDYIGGTVPDTPQSAAERYPLASKTMTALTGGEMRGPEFAPMPIDLIDTGQPTKVPSSGPDYAGSFIGGASDAATLGLTKKILGPDWATAPDEKSHGAEVAGSLLGMLAPYGAAGKLFQVAESAPALAKIVSAALTMGVPALGRETINAASGDPVNGLDVANETALGATFGLAAPIMQKLAGVEDVAKITGDVKAPVNMIDNAPAVSPAPEGMAEYGAGVSPDQAKSAFEKLYKKSEKGDRFVNIFGTPEVVLRGRGIVEPFQEGKALLEAHKHKIQAQLNDILGDVIDNPKARTELFNKLDDPEAALEGKTAELRKYLDDLHSEINKHRVARGQNEIPYRKGYITHLIEDPQQISTIFQDVKIPKFLKFAFEKRKGGGKYKTDVVQALETYTDAALRDIYYGDALYRAIPKVEALNKFGDRPIISKKVITSPDGSTTEVHFYNLGDAPLFSERKYADEFLKNQLGWPTFSEKAIAGLGIPVNTQKAVSQGVTQLFYKSLLGAALDTGVKNLTQGINTLAEYGGMPSMRGYAKLVTRGGVKSARSEHLLEEFEPLLQSGDGGRFMGVKVGGTTGEVLKKFDGIVLSGPMRFSEFVNRGVTFHTALDDAIKSGKSIEEANQIAHAAVRKLQFGYGKLDQSPFLRGALAKPLAQFSSYPLKEAELLYRWAGEKGGKAKLLRYFATVGALVAGGTYAGIDISNTFPNPFRAVDPNSKNSIKLPGSDKSVRFDPTKMLTSGFMPSGAPPAISTVKDIATGMMSEDPYEVARAKRQTVTSLIPGGRYGTKIYEAVKELGGEPLRDARDRIIRQPSPKEAILKLLGFSSTQGEIDRTQRSDIKEVEDFYKSSRQKLVDAIIAGDEKTVNATIAKIEKKYPALLGPMFENMSQSIQDEAKNKELTSQERFTDERLRQIIQSITSKQ